MELLDVEFGAVSVFFRMSVMDLGLQVLDLRVLVLNSWMRVPC